MSIVCSPDPPLAPADSIKGRSKLFAKVLADSLKTKQSKPRICCAEDGSESACLLSASCYYQQSADDLQAMRECAWVICKYYTILYKGLEPGRFGYP